MTQTITPTATNLHPHENLISFVANIPTYGRTWELRDYENAVQDLPEFRALGYTEKYQVLGAGILRKKQTAMQERETAKKVRAAKPKKNAKRNGAFKSRRLKNFPDYCIDENGQIIGPAGTVLRFRWNGAKPYVRIGGKDRAVYWLLVEAGFEEHPNDKKERRAQVTAPGPTDVNGTPIATLKKAFNDGVEAEAEDPELFGPESRPESAGYDTWCKTVERQGG